MANKRHATILRRQRRIHIAVFELSYMNTMAGAVPASNAPKALMRIIILLRITQAETAETDLGYRRRKQ